MVFARLAREKEQGGTTREKEAGRPSLYSQPCRVVIVDLYRMTREIVRRGRRVSGLSHNPEDFVRVIGISSKWSNKCISDQWSICDSWDYIELKPLN